MEIGIDFAFLIKHFQTNCLHPIKAVQVISFLTTLEKLMLKNPYCFVIEERQIQMQVLERAVYFGSAMKGPLWGQYFPKIIPANQ